MNSKKLLIFLVDDDEDDRMIFRDALEKIGISLKLVCFQNGEIFIKTIGNTNSPLPDFVFIDYNMPIKNASACLDTLKEMDVIYKTKIFIYSTSTDPTIVKSTFQQGAYGYICKPPSYAELKSVLEETLKDVKAVNQRPDFNNYLINS